MKERPILFSGPMIRAILDGKKTMTRRVVKNINPHTVRVVEKDANQYSCATLAEIRHVDSIRGRHFEARGPVSLDRPDSKECGYHTLDCPYGSPGDRLWVREAWQGLKDYGHGHTVATREDIAEKQADIRYRATDESGWVPPLPWRPSIHMPRWACRIVLEIVSVRVERLYEISEYDAKNEGMLFHDGRGINHSGWRWDRSHGYVYPNCRSAFGHLWIEINGRESWDANPWVWVVEFKRIGA